MKPGDIGDSSLPDRGRLGWWLLLLVLAGVAAFIAHAFIGMLVLGVFGYYATRPICHRIDRVIDSDRVAALLTVLAVLIPVLGVILYALAQLVLQIQRIYSEGATATLLEQVGGIDGIPEAQRDQLRELVRDPSTLLGGSGGLNPDPAIAAFQGLFGGLLLVSLSLTITYLLLANDGELSDVLVQLFGGRDTAIYGYASAVDSDLESVFFGNLLFAGVMALVATATYWLTNALAPGDLQVPMVLVLGFLTGVASLIPIVVGKLVYVPVVAYLGVQAAGSWSASLWFVALVAVAYFLVLDILPQTFVQPYLSGRKVSTMLVLFAYILGPILFGWYGFFLLPILFILMFQAVITVLPELLHGRPLRATPAIDTEAGSDAGDQFDVGRDADGTADADPDAGDRDDGGPSTSAGDQGGSGNPSASGTDSD
jgi:predicted PurR-regulated permease PerM